MCRDPVAWGFRSAHGTWFPLNGWQERLAVSFSQGCAASGAAALHVLIKVRVTHWATALFHQIRASRCCAFTFGRIP
jgi:hypothetical protein